MNVVVQKFGGSSVQDVEKIEAAANHIYKTSKDGNAVIVVVSAMGEHTDNLFEDGSSNYSSPTKQRSRHAS